MYKQFVVRLCMVGLWEREQFGVGVLCLVLPTPPGFYHSVGGLESAKFMALQGRSDNVHTISVTLASSRWIVSLLLGPLLAGEP
jgi:hypothetical protein